MPKYILTATVTDTSPSGTSPELAAAHQANIEKELYELFDLGAVIEVTLEETWDGPAF